MKKRPAPVRCATCGGFVYGPAIGESAEIVRKVKHTAQAKPENLVCACGECGSLYEVRTEKAA